MIDEVVATFDEAVAEAHGAMVHFGGFANPYNTPELHRRAARGTARRG